ncbi:MAG TPA: M4 family metallopeptidase, partial [Pirellulaceae bacterium]
MIYGDGNGTTYGPLVTLDIAGHEITHGVVEFTSGLIYANESGALNESFADIFGEVIENYASGTNDWLMGDQIGIGQSGALRSFSNPNQFSDPDTYLGNFWYTATGDNGGVHTNSGVQNKWFYNLTVGGAGVDDNGVAYNVTGIGMQDAAAIAYRNTDVYLAPSSSYIQARDGAVQSAIDIFGFGSQQHLSTVAAWSSVGIYDPHEKSIGTLTAVDARGSLVYQGSHSDNLALGVTDNLFKLSLDAGQSVTAAAEGTLGLAPSVTIRDPNGVVVAQAAPLGSTAIAQSAPVSLAGEYTIMVGSNGATDGHYHLRVYLNSDAEAESFGGGNNDSLANAQNIESSALQPGESIPGATADRLAVTGSLVSRGNVVGSQDLESGSL